MVFQTKTVLKINKKNHHYSYDASFHHASFASFLTEVLTVRKYKGGRKSRSRMLLAAQKTKLASCVGCTCMCTCTCVCTCMWVPRVRNIGGKMSTRGQFWGCEELLSLKELHVVYFKVSSSTLTSKMKLFSFQMTRLGGSVIMEKWK